MAKPSQVPEPVLTSEERFVETDKLVAVTDEIEREREYLGGIRADELSPEGMARLEYAQLWASGFATRR